MERKIQIVNHGTKTKEDISVKKVDTKIFYDEGLTKQFKEFSKRNNEVNFNWYSSDLPFFKSLKVVNGKVIYEVGSTTSIETLGFLSLMRNRKNSLEVLKQGKGFERFRDLILKNGVFYLTKLYFSMGQIIIGITKDEEIILLRRSKQLSEGPGRYNVFAGFISSVNELDGKKVDITDFFGQAKAELLEESGLSSSDFDNKRLQLNGLVRGLYNSYLPGLAWSYKFNLTSDEILGLLKRANKFDNVHTEHDSVLFLPIDKIGLLFSKKGFIDRRGVKFDPAIAEDDNSKTGIVDDTIGALLSYLLNNNSKYFEKIKRILKQRNLAIEVIDVTKSSKKFSFREGALVQPSK
ncbi:MAG: hypothetical protein AABW46_04410 [Nanoarchaeota archaeon]